MTATQTIFRVASRHKPYAQLGNAMLRDRRLSFTARGALAMILSYPPDWQFNLGWLCKEGDIGRDKARSIIRELEECGYCQRSQVRNDDGTLGKSEYLFSDEPDDIQPTADGKAGDGLAGDGESDTTKKERDKEKKSQRSSELENDDATRRPAVVERYVTEDALDACSRIAVGWDRQFLLKTFLDWPGSKEARDLDKAFVGWVKSFTKGKPPA